MAYSHHHRRLLIDEHHNIVTRKAPHLRAQLRCPLKVAVGQELLLFVICGEGGITRSMLLLSATLRVHVLFIIFLLNQLS